MGTINICIIYANSSELALAIEVEWKKKKEKSKVKKDNEWKHNI